MDQGSGRVKNDVRTFAKRTEIYGELTPLRAKGEAALSERD
jgi:hypothetical protein